MRLMLALLLVTGLAQADFGTGTTTARLEPHKGTSRIVRAQQGDAYAVAVTGQEGSTLACGVRDPDGDVLHETMREGASACVMSFTAGASGKYKIVVVNQGDETTPIVITVDK